MAIFGLIADAQAAKRQVLRSLTQPLKDVSRRLRTIRILIWVVQAWTAVLNALNAILKALMAVLRFIGFLPLAPVRAFVRVLNTALARLLDVIDPIRNALNRFAPRLRALDTGLKEARETISKIVNRLRVARAKLLLVETLARALEPQQDLLERILPQSLLDRLRMAIARLEELSRQLTMVRMALIALFAPLDMLLSVLKSVSDEIEKLFGVLRAILASLNPLRGALNAIRAAIRRLLQNPIVRAVLDGLSFFLSTVEALFDAVLEASGIKGVLDAILRRVAAVQGILRALDIYRQRLRELIGQLNAIRAQLNAILALLDEIIAVIDDIIAALQGIQLPVKTLIEASLTDYSDLIEHRDAPAHAETFTVEQVEIPEDTALAAEIEDLNGEVRLFVRILDRVPARARLRVPADVLIELDQIAPQRMPIDQIPGLMSGEELIDELHLALAGSTDEVVALLEQNDIPVLDAQGRQALKDLYATFDPAKPVPSDDPADTR